MPFMFIFGCLELKRRFCEIPFPKSIVYTDVVLDKRGKNYKFLFLSKNAKSYPGWALIDIQSFSALIERFLRFQRCSELKQPTLILTSLVITDSVMNISEHLWFRAEHYWQAANRQRPWKKPKKCFFFNIEAEETRNRKIQNNF